MYLVLLETASNQKYIFSTNKLKENVGASELTYRAGTQWVLNAVGDICNNPSLSVWQDSQRLRKMLLDPSQNPPIEDSATSRIEIIVAASGKALLLVREEADAKSLIQAVTLKALTDAPGLEVSGVYLSFDWERDPLGEKNRELHRRYEATRSSQSSSDLRFLRVPVAAECQNSGLPASMLKRNPEGQAQPLSQVSIAKQDVSAAGKKRVGKLLDKIFPNSCFAGDTRDLESIENLDWLAIVHADGNGLGEIFLGFHDHIQATAATDNRRYINQLRQFSIGLDICTEKAFMTALSSLIASDFPSRSSTDKTSNKQIIPLTPLVLGGDDLTVICEGRSALPFAAAFLAAFEQATATSHEDVGTIVADVAQQALGIRRLSACAGVAVVKPHFPFSVAYDMAEALMDSAKKVKTEVTHTESSRPYPCSALDFHIVYDASDVSLERIRSKQNVANAQLYKRPYVVTPIEDLTESTGYDWATFHDWRDLTRRVSVLASRDEEGRRQLPNSQVHDLRVALYQGKAVADARYKLIRERYKAQGIVTLAGSDQSLFQTEPGTDIAATALIDALDAAAFMETAMA